MDAGEATERLASLVNAEADPALDSDELIRLLDQARTTDAAGNPPANRDATAWTADTELHVGTVVNVSGRYWIVRVPGTTGSVEPDWPDRSGYVRDPGQMIEDGSVTWFDNGTAWKPTWDMNRAAMLGWELKAGKASARYNFGTDDQRFDRARVSVSCREQAMVYRRKLAASAHT